MSDSTGKDQAPQDDAEGPEFPGCRKHPDQNARADCEACCTLWRVKFGHPKSNALMSPGMLRNRFRRGQSGNPNGRPKGETPQEILDRLMEEGVETKGGELLSSDEIMMSGLRKLATTARPTRWATELLMKRRVPEKQQIEAHHSGTVEFVIDEQDAEWAPKDEGDD